MNEQGDRQYAQMDDIQRRSCAPHATDKPPSDQGHRRLLRRRSGQLQSEQMVTFNRNDTARHSVFLHKSGHHRPESLVSLNRNRWSASIVIGGQVRAEYAVLILRRNTRRSAQRSFRHGQRRHVNSTDGRSTSEGVRHMYRFGATTDKYSYVAA